MAVGNRLPAISVVREYAEAGLLLSYGSIFQIYFVGPPSSLTRSSRVRNLAELPVEQPTKFELVINLKTAKAWVIVNRHSSPAPTR